MKFKVIFGRGKNRYFIDGREVSKKEYDAASTRRIDGLLESGQMLPSQSPAAWPMAPTDSMGVHPDQIQEAMQADRELGVPTEYAKDGSVIFRDRGHRKAFLKAHQKHDQSGGYGD